MNLGNTTELSLYVFDTTTRTGRVVQYPFPMPLLSIIPHEHSLVFGSVVPDKTGGVYHLMELDAEGNIIRTKQGTLNMQNDPVKVLPGAGGQYILFYQYNKKTNDSSVMRGSLLGADWEVKKQLQYGFKHDADLDI